MNSVTARWYWFGMASECLWVYVWPPREREEMLFRGAYFLLAVVLVWLVKHLRFRWER